MVVLNKIYTKTGDDGTTALGSGERRPKHDLRIEAYGTVDETNAVVGLVRLHTAQEAPELDAVLGRIQNDLFDLGADLATPDTGEDLGYEPLRVTDGQVEALEQAIDTFNAELSPLRSFVLPGGTAASAHLHLARTVSRRAERLMVELAVREKVTSPAVRYMNRLSDFFFVASRFLNAKGDGDVLWVPGKNR
ncbi:cob(I)yrinic acid a,c-diamide adenosyltransferase [Roseibium polysiphoniae]|uniref:Corrinoid adenosyltransferase n=1 Tax=Roseibium polysiphoniae TaxID=2571221 RepID=A0A944CGD3_9HYPH|nr:cob(I)yrinic acid a,c-diamide adenosyltransferase [Roseibium polysiphoniae]MBD8877544.1 cob(I)yrinic acid a,c-diamide adenosyltransferase [Roseibium polysiphoniae]MBS8261766.1 cob(I)yrinic acid a,c-diamide adenosyltransferase [Roseibium polysiphoniae]